MSICSNKKKDKNYRYRRIFTRNSNFINCINLIYNAYFYLILNFLGNHHEALIISYEDT